ncbi:YqiA/YcfP family alpha/beta fold hydrolase [Salinimicrobium sediminilitoris]|uniref:YqiA/YcfP family alpha/beta fold hydrolase n=1 Tax=Salinimicrobium sediminilitoris TaxID=2876715 RepID=UPI001E50AAEB|nr:YqiA/YcfP family alpha/beta fold hydrolase [Salinimicrobium sediminilitoris]MCC8360692.1 alpha/beta hydrolase [Salinimicrobium sediminilitoris]
MNILYLHGLDSKLSPEKKAILEKYGKVYAPDLNYYDNPDAIQTIIDLHTDVEIDAVIGSSMGGFAGYYVSNALSRPALLFNPALMKRSVPQNVPSQENYNNLKQIVIGQKDDVVSPADTLTFLSEDFNPVTDIHLHLVPWLDHNIPVEFFEEEVESFFRKLGY